MRPCDGSNSSSRSRPHWPLRHRVTRASARPRAVARSPPTAARAASRTGKHYGFGAKTAIPRVAEYALIFTREAGSRHRVLGLLSSAFSGSAGAKQTKLPLCSWLAEGGP